MAFFHMPDLMKIEGGTIESATNEMNVDELVKLFNAAFFKLYNVKLVKGGREPVYLPASDTTPYGQIIFSYDYYSSALHEISHWCIAGLDRHDQVDFGYWYAPDGRSAQEQSRFEQVEVAPQALEWIFSVMAGQRFNISADNLGADSGYPKEFAMSVYEKVKAYCENGLPERAEQFRKALTDYYCLHLEAEVGLFRLADINYPEDENA